VEDRCHRQDQVGARKLRFHHSHHRLMHPPLFDLASEPIATHAGTGHTCGKCSACVITHRWRSDWLYCKKRVSGRTDSGFPRVNARQEACELFEVRP
jgi:hypothetical protein